MTIATPRAATTRFVPAFIAVMFAFVLALPIVTAQDEGQPGDRLPDARELFEGHIKAIGGHDAINAHRNRVLHGSLTSNMPGADRQLLTVWTVTPDKIRAEIEMPGVARLVRAYDGKQGWAVGQDQKPFLLQGEELEDLRETAHFNGEADYEKMYRSFETVGRGTMADRPVYEVRVISQSGKEARVYFDVEDGLMIGKVVRKKMQAAEVTIRAIFQDYKETEGMKMPMRQVQLIGGTEFIVTYRRVEINADESKFPDFSPPPELLRDQPTPGAGG